MFCTLFSTFTFCIWLTLEIDPSILNSWAEYCWNVEIMKRKTMVFPKLFFRGCKLYNMFLIENPLKLHRGTKKMENWETEYKCSLFSYRPARIKQPRNYETNGWGNEVVVQIKLALIFYFYLASMNAKWRMKITRDVAVAVLQVLCNFYSILITDRACRAIFWLDAPHPGSRSLPTESSASHCTCGPAGHQ